MNEVEKRREFIIPTFCATHCGGTCMLKVHVRDGVITPKVGGFSTRWGVPFFHGGMFASFLPMECFIVQIPETICSIHG